MKMDWKSWWKQELDDDKKRMLGMLLIPLVVLVLILVIVVADRSGKKEEPKTTAEATTALSTMGEAGNQAESEPRETATTAEPTTTEEETEPTDPFETEKFKRDSVPEIKTLLEKYFAARAAADPAAMNALYGGEELSESQLQSDKNKMWNNSKYITGFKNVATYVMSGKTADSFLVYATAEIEFRSVENTAPMIMWCYVTKDAEGNYLLNKTETLPDDVLKYVDEANRSEEVRRLARDVNGRLKEALNADADLNSIYGILNAASPVWEGDEQETDVQVEIIDESAAADGESADGAEAGQTEGGAEPQAGAETQADAGSAAGTEAAAPAGTTAAGTTAADTAPAETTAQ